MKLSEYLKQNNMTSKEYFEMQKRRSKGVTTLTDYRNSLYKTIGFDTFESDLNTTGSTVFDAYNGWQTAETMQNTKVSAQKLYDRIGAYEEYRTKFGKDTLPDLSELYNTYETALEGWDDRTALYGNYKNAEAFDKAVKQEQLSQKFTGLSYADVQYQAAHKYAEGSDEYNYLKNYTQYSTADDFDRAIKGTEWIDNIVAKQKEFSGKIKSKEYDEYAKSIGFDNADALNEYINGKLAYRKELEQAKNIYLLDNGPIDDYKHLEQNDDFAEHSKYIPSYDESSGEHFLQGDTKYEYINNTEGIRDFVKMSAAGAGSKDGYAEDGLHLLRENEVAYYNYLKYWDDQNGTKKADKFLKDMEDALQKRVSDTAATNREKMLENPFMATAFTLTSPIATIAGGMGNLIASGKEIITGSGYNPYDPLREISNANAHGREVVGKNIAEATEGFELFGQNIPSFLYNTGMSILDTTVGGATMGPAYTLLMGTNAYQQRAKELTEQGYDSATVQGLAIVSGALEAAFEYAQFDHLIKLKDADSISKVLYNAFASQGNVEGLEEFCTSLGTMIAENAFLGEDSTYNKMHKDLLARGYSEKEANTEVAKAMASELGWSYAGGYISGSTLGGGTSTFQYVGNSKAGAEIRQAEQIGNVFDMANNPEIAEAYDIYTRYANKGVNADNITNAQIGNLYNTARSEATMGFNSAYKDMNRAKGVIDKQKAIRESETSSESKKGRAEAKLDKAISKYTDAQTRMGKYGETLSKVSTIGDSVVETNVKKAIEKHDAEVKAKHEAEVKKLSSGVETSVISKTDKAIEIKGIKDRDTLITNEGEVAFKDVELSDNDARLFSYARGMATDEASLYYEQYDGKADVEQYTNDFNRAVYYARHSGFTENYILEHKGSLSGEQVSAIYKNTVMAEARVKEAEHNKLISTTANNTPYTGYIDDSIFDYKNTSTSGKINWNSLNQRQKNSVDFLKVFAAKSGMNLVFTPYSKTSNGAFDIKDNTIYVSAYAGILFEKNKLRDSIIPTASHEITHWMEEKSPELYVKLKDTVLDALEVAMGKSQAELISDEIARLDRTHKDKKHTEKDAINEIVARACEDMLSMSKEGRKLFDSMTEEEKKTFVGKVKEILENLMKWIDDFLSSYKSETKEARALQNYKEKLQEISKIWDEMLVRSIEVNQALEKADVFGHLENGISADGTTIVGQNNLQMSDKTYNEGGRDFLINWLEGQKDLSDEDKQNIVEQTDRVAEIMRAIDRGGEIPEYSRWANLEVVRDENGEKVLSVIVKNGDYAMNIDFSQVCKKRVALNAVLNKMVQSGDLNVFTLSETDVSELNAIIKEYEFEIACALCFVDSKRYRVGAWADSFCEGSDEKKSGKTVHKYGFNEMVRSLIPEGSNIKVDEFNFTNRAIKNQPKKNLLSDAKDTDLDFSLIDSIMANNDSKSAQYRYAKAIKENPDIRKILNSAEIISSIGLDAIRLESPKLYGLINGHQGTAKPKFAHDVVAYGNDVLKASNFTPEKAKMVGGVRCQSFSDFMAVMVVDYAQFVSELAAKKLTAHSYTKEPLFVKLFGLTGMKINMSLVPKAIEMTPEQQKQFAILKDKNANKKSKAYKDALAEYEKLSENAGLDENGNYIWEDESFPYDIAMEIVVDKKYSKNCGTIAVGISNKHIKKLLADDKISMVIPYHKSGLNHEVAMMRDIALYKDYTDVQNTRDKATGKKLEKGQADFDFYGDLYGKDGKEGTHDPKQTAQNYLKWCYENNYIPKFDDFMLDDNYYKLLIDFRVYDVDGTYTEQEPVQTIYPSNEEFKDLILNGVKDKNGKVYGGLKQQQSTSDRLDAESQQIIDEYKKRLKEKYGEDVLQHSDSELMRFHMDNDGLQFSDKDGDIKKAEELSETELRDLLDRVQYGVLDDDTYIPLRANTPEFFICVVHEHSEGKVNIMHVPMATQVEHMRQNMEEEEGLSYGDHRPHNFDVDDIVTISKEMGHPAYIVLQKNGRYAMVVSFYNKDNKKVVVSIDFASDNEPIKNYKYKQYMNGYNEGFYNIIVTQYEPDDFTKYLEETEIVYDKKKMNGRYQVGSGRVVTFTHDTPFINDSVSQPKGKINEQTVNNDDLQHSDKDDSSVYDLMGETGSIVKENKKLGEDVGRLKEIIGTEEVDNKKFLSLANYMKKISGSTMDSAKLGKMLKEAYTSMQQSGTLSWRDVVMNTHHIATALMTEDLGVSVDYFKRVMQEIRKDKISLSAEQRARVEEQFGNYGNFHKYVFGRMNVTNDGKPLTEVWGNWAKIYPSLFDANLQGIEQIDALIEAVDILKSTSNMMEEYERAEAIRHLSTELYNQFWNVAAESSTSDQAKTYKAEHKAVMEDLRKGYEQRQKALVVHPTGETALKYESILKKSKETKRKEVAEAKERGRERLSMYKENAERKTKIQRITSNVLSLNEMLVKNSKDKHIPEAMKGAVTELLQAIDFSSKRMLKGGEPTQRDISLEKALGHLKDAITEGSQEIGDMLDEMYGSGIDDLTKELVKSVDGHMALIEGQVFTLNEMSLDDLKKLDTIVQIMKQTVNNVNKFHVAQYNRGVQALGVRSTEEIDSRKKVFKDNNKHFEKLKTHTYWNNLNPFYAFKNLGEASQRIFTALQDGQDKLAFLSKEVIDFAESVYSAKDYDKWSDTYFDFEIPQLNGKVAKFSMNVPQIMSLYCVTKQEDARRHILYGNENGDGGGITIVETDKKEAVRNNIRLTEADLNSIIAKLDNVKNNNGDKSAKAVADELQEFMCRRGADLGNEISMARWGINSFGITNYFPIKVSEGSVPIKNDAPGVNSTSMLELLNMSFTHARNHFAKQSVEIGDVFDVFANHMSNMVRYNAMALPILDMYKWMNCRGVDLYGTEYSVQTSIKNTFGDESWKYFSTLLKDISGGTKKVTRDKFLVKFFKNAKVAKVAANLRVALLQFTSYVRAGAVMDNKYLLKALAHKPKSSKAKENSGIALWKSMGYYDTDITRGLTEQIKHTSTIKDKLVEWSLKGAEKADEITWGYLWNACELEIRETRKDIEVGSKEFIDAVALRLREVIYRTQVVDSMLTRSQMMRSPDGWDKVLTTFASENTLSFNLAMDAFTSYELDKRSVGKEKAKEKNKKYIRKVMTAYIITNVVTATLQSLFDAFRDYDEDEKDEEYWMKLMLTNFASNSSVLGKTPLGNIVLSVVQGFTPARMDVDWLNSFVKTGKQVYKLFTGEGNSEKAVRNALKTLSDSTGIAVYNVYRDIFALYKMFADD